MTYPGFDTQWLTQHGAVHTAQEIAHQPRLWREMAATLTATEADDNAFLQPLFALPGLRIVMTGAGTSAYAGEALAPWLVRQALMPERLRQLILCRIPANTLTRMHRPCWFPLPAPATARKAWRR